MMEEKNITDNLLNRNEKNISINELINLVYIAELSQNTLLINKVYKMVRTKYLSSFKTINYDIKNETALVEQEIMRRLYDAINKRIELLSEKKQHKRKIIIREGTTNG